MQVDWFTLIAQIINFAILVWLLQHFLYGPINRTMQERREGIQAQVQEAEDKAAAAEEQMQEYEQKEQELTEQRDQLVDEAAEEAEARRKELLEEAREDIDHARRRWHEALEREKQDFLDQVRDRAGEQVLQVTRRVLTDLADADLQDKIIPVFISRLAEASEEDRAALDQAYSPENNRLRVSSAFELSQDDRRRLTEAVHDHLYADAELTFDTDKQLLGGLELRTDGAKLSWSIRGYLDELYEQLQQALQEVEPDHE